MSDPSKAADFSSLGLSADLCARLAQLKFAAPTPVQAAAIPPLLAGEDLMGQAATGTGKTAAFGLPLVTFAQAQDAGEQQRRPLGLVLVPTRELAVQVGGALSQFAGAGRVSVAVLTGGAPMHEQRRCLMAGAQLVVATPGRLLDHLRRQSLDPSGIAHLVLDEADEMLDMGFAEELEAIFAQLPARRQTALMSATLPPRIVGMAKRHLRSPKVVRVAAPAVGDAQPSRMQQWAHGVERRDKLAALRRVLAVHQPASCIVFCRTRQDVDQLRHALAGSRQVAAALHGGMDQAERDHVMRAFRSGQVQVLVATDVAARGLDVEHISHVINFDLPASCDTYLHRIGRTGRAGRSGCAISLVERGQARAMLRFAQVLKQAIDWRPLPSGAQAQACGLEHMNAQLQALAAQPLLGCWEQASAGLQDLFCPQQLAQLVLRLGLGSVAEAQPQDIASFDPTRPAAGRPAGRGRTLGDRAQLFFGLGRRGGMQPRDLVACLQEVGRIDARSIGRIEIGPNFSLLEVPAAALSGLVANMRDLHVDGRAVEVRADRQAGRRQPVPA